MQLGPIQWPYFFRRTNEYGMLDTQLEEMLRKRLQGALPGNLAHEKMRAQIIHEDAARKPFQLSPKEGAVLILLYPDEHASDWKFPLIQRPLMTGFMVGKSVSLEGKKSIRIAICGKLPFARPMKK